MLFVAVWCEDFVKQMSSGHFVGRLLCVLNSNIVVNVGEVDFGRKEKQPFKKFTASKK